MSCGHWLKATAYLLSVPYLAAMSTSSALAAKTPRVMAQSPPATSQDQLKKGTRSRAMPSVRRATTVVTTQTEPTTRASDKPIRAMNASCWLSGLPPLPMAPSMA